MLTAWYILMGALCTRIREFLQNLKESIAWLKIVISAQEQEVKKYVKNLRIQTAAGNTKTY
jgi:hypothetical protein